jgi:PIN domain nuclease of toxin-antitoxin system
VIVLDTHVLLWWVSGVTGRISPSARAALDAETRGGTILVSAISAWEIALLVARKRLELTLGVGDWLKTVAEVPGVDFVAVDRTLSVDSVELPGEFHRDPADRIIVATARSRACPLLTADEKILAYPHVQTVW